MARPRLWTAWRSRRALRISMFTARAIRRLQRKPAIATFGSCKLILRERFCPRNLLLSSSAFIICSAPCIHRLRTRCFLAECSSSKPTPGRRWSSRTGRTIPPSCWKLESCAPPFRLSILCFIATCVHGRELLVWLRKNPAIQNEQPKVDGSHNLSGCTLQSHLRNRILKSGHENSARAVQSYRWRLCRKFGSHLEPGGASETTRRRSRRFFRTLSLRVSPSGSFGTPRLHRTQP